MSKSKSISSKKKNDLVLSDIEQNTILEILHDGVTAYELAKEKQIKLKTLYNYLDRNPKFKEEFNKAQEIGIKTLVEKMCVIFNTETTGLDNNDLLFVREKKDWLKWIAPRISSLFQEKQKIDVKSNSSIRISWEEPSELIDVSTTETVPTPPKD
jgi:hypothetical protein|tara:strand:- start:1383 stop:1847 length:465 start_codon:yes stop_codon:yes gene_type:complete